MEDSEIPLGSATARRMMALIRALMKFVPFGGFVACAVLSSCVGFDPPAQSKVEDVSERPYVALLPFGFDIEITALTTVKTVEGTFSAEEELKQLNHTLREIEEEARWLLLSRLATGQGFRFVALEQVDGLAEELQMKPGVPPTPEQCVEFRRRLGVDLLIVNSILDYGKIRWQWLVAGMFADISLETVVIGLATEWNPAIILGNVGFELLTSTPLWFGGAYLFGVSMRPVRMEARAFETQQGYPVWQSMEASVYAWSALKMLPEDVREKKESQLKLNLAEIIESFGDSLTKEGFMASSLRGQSVGSFVNVSLP